MTPQDQKHLENFKKWMEDNTHKTCNLFDMMAEKDKAEAEKNLTEAIEKLTKKLNDSKK